MSLNLRCVYPATQAHKAIAELVEKGYIKVIVTTNFDRLIETAIEEIGITPTIIHTTDSIQGALPIQHTKCTIIKVHGDYLDTRIKNTPEELEKYDQPLDDLLDIIFDEYGLILCGWSGLWDTALRDAIIRCPNRRFTTFWTGRSEPEDEKIKDLLHRRKAELITIKDADSFFEDLKEKVLSLEEINQRHPFSPKVAVSTLKRYLVDDSSRIKLHDLVNEEIEKLFEEISIKNFPLNIYVDYPKLLQIVKKYESLSKTILSLIITGCYFGEEKHNYLWINSIERIGDTLMEFGVSYSPELLCLRLYPSLLLFYSSGIASLAGQKYDTFADILRLSKIKHELKSDLAINFLNPLKVMTAEDWNMMLENPYSKKPTPASEYIFNTLSNFF